MTSSENPSDNLGVSLVLSVSLHVFLVLIFTVRTLFFPSESMVFEDTIRVDLVGLPDKIEKIPIEPDIPDPVPNTVPQPEIKAQPVIPTAVKTPTKSKQEVKTEQNSALNKLKALSAIDKLKKAESSPLPENKNEPRKEHQYKGNAISPGTARTGIDKLQHHRYLGEIKQHIKKNWFLPEWLADKGFRAQVNIKLDKNGNVAEHSFVNASGNASFDKLVLNTIERSSPFPAPPEKFVDILKELGLVLGFPE